MRFYIFYWVSGVIELARVMEDMRRAAGPEGGGGYLKSGSLSGGPPAGAV